MRNKKYREYKEYKEDKEDKERKTEINGKKRRKKYNINIFTFGFCGAKNESYMKRFGKR